MFHNLRSHATLPPLSYVARPLQIFMLMGLPTLCIGKPNFFASFGVTKEGIAQRWQILFIDFGLEVQQT